MFPEFLLHDGERTAIELACEMHLAPILILCPMRHRCLVALGVNYESARQNPFAHWSLNHPWPLVILDESHLAKKRVERSLAIRRPVRLPKRHRLAVIAALAFGSLGAIPFSRPHPLYLTFTSFMQRYAIFNEFLPKPVA